MTHRLLNGNLRAFIAAAMAAAAMAGLPAQNRMPANQNAYLVAANRPADDYYGDYDKVQVIFFEVDDTVASPLYFGIFDPGADGADNPNIGTPNYGDIWYRVYGGTGAYTDPSSRALAFADSTTARAGALVSELHITAAQSANAGYNNSWTYLPVVYPSQGEHVGNKRIFKFVVAHARDPDDPFGTTLDGADDYYNRYQVVVWTAESQSPGTLSSVRAFAYSLSVSLTGTVDLADHVNPAMTDANWDWNLYPFVPEGTSNGTNIRIEAWDADWRGGNTNATPYIPNGRDGFCWTLHRGALTGNNFINIPGDEVNYPDGTAQRPGSANGYPVNLPIHTGRTWRFQMDGGREGTTEPNGVDIWAASDSDLNNLEVNGISVGTSGTALPLRIYAAEYVAQTPYRVVLLPATQTVASGTAATLTAQILDVDGNPAPFVRTINVAATGGTTPRINGIDANEDLTTDDSGSVTFTVANSGAGEVTLTPTTAAWGDGTDAGATATFILDPPPVPTSMGNTAFPANLGTAQALPSIRVTDSGTSNIGSASDFRVIIPGALGALFDTSVLNVTVSGANAGTWPVTYESGNKIAVIAVAGSPMTLGETYFAGLRLYPPAATYTASTGSLGFSWDGSGAPQATDDKVVTIQSLTYDWIGTTTVWATPTNWSPAGPPPASGAAIRLRSTAGVDPVVPTATHSFTSVIVEAGRTLTIPGTADFSIAGPLDVYGAVSLGEGVSVAGDLYVYAGANVSLNAETLTVSGMATNLGTVDAGTGRLALSGSYTGSGSLTLGAAAALPSLQCAAFTSSGTINANGESRIDASGSIAISGTLNTPANLTINASGTGRTLSATPTIGSLDITGTYSLNSAITLAGNLTIGAAGNLDVTASNRAVTVNGNWRNDRGTAGFTARSGTVTISNAASPTPTHTITGNTTFYNLSSTTTVAATINFASGSTQTIMNGITLTGVSGYLLTLTGAAAWNLAADDATTPTNSVNYVAVRYGNVADAFPLVLAPTRAANLGNNDTDDGGENGYWIFPGFTWTGTVSTSLATGGNWNTGTVPGTLDSIIIPDAGTTNFDPILAADSTFLGVTVQASGILDLATYGLTVSAGTAAFTVAGRLRLSGDATQAVTAPTLNAGSTAEYYGANLGVPFSLGNAYVNLELAGATRRLAAANLTVTGNASVGATAILDMATYGIAVTGTFTVNGRMRMSGDAAQDVDAPTFAAGSVAEYYGGTGGFVAGTTYSALQVTAGTRTAGAGLTANSTSVSAGAVMDISTYALSGGAGGVTNNGTFRISGGNQTIAGAKTNGNPSLVEYYGTGAAGMNWGASYHNLTIANTASGTFSLGASITVAGAVDVQAATLALNNFNLDATGNIGGAGTIAAAAGGAAEQVSTAADWTIAAYAPANSLVTLDGAGNQTVSGDADFYGLSIGARLAGTVSFSSALTVTNAFSSGAGAYDVSITGDTVSFTPDATFANTGSMSLGNAATDSLSFAGGLDTTACGGGTALFGLLSTTNAALDLGATTLGGNSSISSGSGAAAIASATDALASYELSLGSATQTGTITVNGATTVSALRTFASNYGIRFNNTLAGGQASVIDTAVTLANTGALSLGNAALDSAQFTNGLDASSCSAITVAGTVSATTAGAALVFGSASAGAATLAGNASVTTDRGDVTFNNSVNGAGFILALSSGAAAGQPGDVSLLGNATDIEDFIVECRVLTLGAAGTPVSVTSDGAGTSPQDDITFTVDSFTSANAANSVNTWANGVFTLQSRGGGSIEFAATNSGLIATASYFSSSFDYIGAQPFVLGGFAYAGDLYVGNEAASLVDYGLEARTTANAYIGDWATSVAQDLDVYATGVIRFSDPSAAPGTANVDLMGGSFSANANVTLVDNAVITANGGISFTGTIDAAAAGVPALTLNSSGAVSVTGAVGSTLSLLSIDTDANGTLALNGGAARTTGAQTYLDPVTLGADTVFTAAAGSLVRFGSTVGGGATACSLTVTNANAQFGGVTGGAANLLSAITVDGTSAVNTASVTTAGNQTFTGAVTLGANATFAANAASVVRFGGSVAGDGVLARSLRVATADARFGGSVGGPANQISTLTVDATCVFNPGAAASIQTTSGMALSSVSGSTFIDSAGFAVTVTGGAGTVNVGSAAVPASGLHIYAPGATVSLGSALVARNLVKYAGNLAMGGNTLQTAFDLVLIGAGYGIADAESAVADLYAYDNALRTGANDPDGILADPRTALVAAVPLSLTPVNPASYGGNVSGLGAVTAGGNFYVNGGTLSPQGASWTLAVPANDDAGVAFAEAYHATIQNCAASGGWIAAPAAPAAEGNTLTGCSGNWDSARPAFLAGTAGDSDGGTVTILDDVLRVEIDSGAFENSRNEISRAVAASSVLVGNGASAFSGSFTNPACTVSTDGAGDIAVFYLRSPVTWNTDANGTGPGDVTAAGTAANPSRSTDRSGAEQNVAVNLEVVKAAGGLFQTLRDSHKNRISHYGAASRFTGAADACRPVLVAVSAGQAADEPILTPTREFDGHNYLQLRYSEPVSVSGLVAGSVNVRATAGFGAMTSGAGNLVFAGLLTVAGSAASGSRDGTPQTEALCRAGYDIVNNGTGAFGADGLLDSGNVLGLHGLHVSVAGFSAFSAPYRFWPGYLTALTDPSDAAAVASAPYNAGITDSAGNPLEAAQDTAPPAGYAANQAKAPVTAQAAVKPDEITFTGWDIARPRIPELGGNYLVVPLATVDQVDHIEIRVAEDDAGVDPEDLRDSSFGYLGGTSFPTIPTAAFLLSDVDLDGGVFYDTGSAFSTGVTLPIFGGSVNVPNDGYFTINLSGAEMRAQWTARSSFYFNYAEGVGRLTDTAGNLLASYAGNLPCVERQAPRMRFASAVNGGNRIYLQFSEPVWHNDMSDLVAGDFDLQGTGLNVSAVEVLSREDLPGPQDPIREVMLTLDGNITANDVFNARIVGFATIEDVFGNAMDPLSTRRITDFGLGIVAPLSASDGFHRDEGAGAAAFGTLRVFDGSGRLFDRNVTVTSRLDAGVAPATPTEMFFDVAPPASVLFQLDVAGAAGTLHPGVWVPSAMPSVFGQANAEARLASPVGQAGSDRSHLVPGGDAEIVDGAEVGFLYRVAGLYCFRAGDPNDPRTFDLFRYRVMDPSAQRGGVTVMNNVIDPTRNERVAIQVDMPRSGALSVLVFTLDGDIVRVLNRSPSASGSFLYSWDGRNAAGRPVGRGLYFIRVVGPGIDEVRKVMVVKPR